MNEYDSLLEKLQSMKDHLGSGGEKGKLTDYYYEETWLFYSISFLLHTALQIVDTGEVAGDCPLDQPAQFHAHILVTGRQALLDRELQQTCK